MRTARRLLAATIAVLLLAAAPARAAGDWPWPVAGPVLTAYSNGSDPYASGQHRGIDIGAAEGEPVVSSTDGTVTFAGAVGSSGLTVGVRTADGRFEVSYLHLAEVSVREGQPVAVGDRVGSVGTSGVRSAEAPHLHFGVREAGTDHAYVDPLTLLSEDPVVATPRSPVVDGSVPPVVGVQAGAPPPAPTAGRVAERARPPAAAAPAGAAPAPSPAPRPAARPAAVPAAPTASRTPAPVRGSGRTARRAGAGPGSVANRADASRPRLGSGPRGRSVRDRAPGRDPVATGADSPAPAPPLAPAPVQAGMRTGWLAAALGFALLVLIGRGSIRRRGRSAAPAGAAGAADGGAARLPSPRRPSGPRAGAARSRPSGARRPPGASAPRRVRAGAGEGARRTSIDSPCPTTSRPRSTT